ncbi:MAG TPA: hypothetical protein VMZ53_33875 [Kofleriaceae bacterium]|nr:hypothetical protein [Kofleriaceae bacterium]
MFRLAFACLLAAGCGRIGFQAPPDGPVDGQCPSDPGCVVGGTCDPLPAGTTCGDHLFCDGAGACSIAEREVGCNGPFTGDQLCQQAGFAGALQATGYYWFQCTGYPERVCPGTGWDFANIRCTTWCGQADCAQVPYCGAGQTAYELSGDGTTVFDQLMYGLDCQSFNPGWLVLLRCY